MLQNFATHSLLTIKMVIITLLVGTGVWLLLDELQTRGLKATFLEHHRHEFEHSERMNRIQLDHHVRRFPELAELVATRDGMEDYLQNRGTHWTTSYPVLHQTLPLWAPSKTLLRSYPLPQVWLLLDENNQVREIYTILNRELPPLLRHPSPLLLKITQNQHYLTSLEGIPFLITSRSIPYHSGDGHATLLLATPVDVHFLTMLQLNQQVSNSVMVLVDGQQNGHIIASSMPEAIPIGSNTSDHLAKYTLGYINILDYGDSELLLKFGTLSPRKEIDKMIEKVLQEERWVRFILGVSLVVSFLAIMILLTRRIVSLNHKVEEFALKELGAPLQIHHEGDQLVVLETKFQHLIGRIKSAHRTLQNNAHELEAVVANVADGIIVIDEESLVISINPAARKLFMAEQPTPFPLLKLVPSEYHQSHSQGLQRLQETGISNMLDRPIEVYGLRSDGKRRLLDMRVSAMTWQEHRHFISIVRDITERKDAELALKTSEERFRSLITLIPHGVEECNTDGVITFSNPARHRMMEKEAGQLIGHAIFENAYPVSDCERIKKYFQNLVTNQPDPTPYFEKNCTLSGKIIDVQVDWTYKRNMEGQLIGFVSIITDITEKLAAEKRIREQQEALAHVQRLQTMGNIASGIAHELNQPLAAILNYSRGCSRRLRSGSWDYHEILAVIDRIGEQAERVGSVMQNIRGFLSKGKINPIRVELTQVVRDAVEFMDSETRRHGVAVRFRTDDREHPVVVDTIQIQQVLQNLMRNAIEAMLESESDFRVLDIALAVHDKDTILLTVHDSGPGIDPRLASELFCPFFTTKPDGMGLGLSISQSIVEHHGGQLWLERGTQSGATFCIHLPMGQRRAS